MQKLAVFSKHQAIMLKIRYSRVSPFWTAFWIIFLAAAAIRLLTFARGLPYIIEVDEPNIYTTVQGWRGLFNGPILQGYPPSSFILAMPSK